MLPLGLTLFLAENSTKEWDNAPGTITPMPEDLPQLPSSESPQHCPTHTGGSRPKALAHPSASWSQFWPQLKPEEPDPANHPCRWIHAEMEKISHCHCWKELVPSGRLSMDTHLIREGLSDAEVLQWAHWQAAVFRLSLAQCKALRWWGAPTKLSGLCLMDFPLPADASSPRDFHAVREEKSLALAWALQACAEELEVPAGILCESVRELQKCIALLMTLRDDDTVEASLLKPMGDKHGTPPRPEEEAVLQDEEVKPWPVPGSPEPAE